MDAESVSGLMVFNDSSDIKVSVGAENLEERERLLLKSVRWAGLVLAGILFLQLSILQTPTTVVRLSEVLTVRTQ